MEEIKLEDIEDKKLYKILYGNAEYLATLKNDSSADEGYRFLTYIHIQNERTYSFDSNANVYKADVKYITLPTELEEYWYNECKEGRISKLQDVKLPIKTKEILELEELMNNSRKYL